MTQKVSGMMQVMDLSKVLAPWLSRKTVRTSAPRHKPGQIGSVATPTRVPMQGYGLGT